MWGEVGPQGGAWWGCGAERGDSSHGRAARIPHAAPPVIRRVVTPLHVLPGGRLSPRPFVTTRRESARPDRGRGRSGASGVKKAGPRGGARWGCRADGSTGGKEVGKRGQRGRVPGRRAGTVGYPGSVQSSSATPQHEMREGRALLHSPLPRERSESSRRPIARSDGESGPPCERSTTVLRTTWGSCAPRPCRRLHRCPWFCGNRRPERTSSRVPPRRT